MHKIFRPKKDKEFLGFIPIKNFWDLFPLREIPGIYSRFVKAADLGQLARQKAQLEAKETNAKKKQQH